MTAPGSGEQITAELAEALRDEQAKHRARYVFERRPWGDGQRLVGCVCGWDGTKLADHGIAALLPVVEAYATRKAAEELRAAAARESSTIADTVLTLADDFLAKYSDDDDVDPDNAYDWLAAQAAEIRGTA